ncbi:glycosyltransferase [Flavobacterium olei]|uniref:glycosyltransferase n=1 Tax=Flavobacterium olei TaxID=1886782 RepID=UPI00321A0CFD
MLKKTVVLSGANITSGGPLTIYNSALIEFSKLSDYNIIAIVNDSSFFYKSDNISFIEIPQYKKFILFKFYFEYIYYKKISKKINADVWISLNDFTPNVSVKKLFTYFHNASIFFNIKRSDLLFSRSVIFQKIYYTIFLRFNIFKNKKFIVQQNWIGKKISLKYNLPISQILIFKPFNFEDKLIDVVENVELKKETIDTFVLFYPTRAIGYKNIELICEALNVLYYKYSIIDIELRITVLQDQNSYTKYLKKKYDKLKIVWLGSISKEEVESNYKIANVLVYPSRLETWGLPLSEFSRYNKPIFAIDLEYVYETVGNYPYLVIFNPDDIMELALLIKNLIEKKKLNYFNFDNLNIANNINSINSWKEILDI